MLKVLKYDWKNGWSSVRYPLLAAAVISVLLGLLCSAGGAVPEVSQKAFGLFVDDGGVLLAGTSLIWIAVMIALFVLTLSVILDNFSSRMFGREAPLTHTLPVETWQLLGGKALGTWLFGVFMVFAALAAILLVMFSAAVSSSYLTEFVRSVVNALPKLNGYHLETLAKGLGGMALGLLCFLGWSLLIVIQVQFICVAARLFGKYHVAGGVIVFVVLVTLENRLNDLIPWGFVVVLLISAACFAGSNLLLKKKLNV